MAVTIDRVGLLERSIGYALGNVSAVVPPVLSYPTPCAGWDLRLLMGHVNDSLATLQEAIDTGRVGLAPTVDNDDDPAAELVETFRTRAGWLLRAWRAASNDDRVVDIVDRPMMASVVAATGALEIAVHGWDISRSCGNRRPIPPTLAVDLLSLCPLVVTEATRHPLFAAPVAVSRSASPSDRLVALLGRRPNV
jgi:uncharacterized protein (TIGR03086 family)